MNDNAQIPPVYAQNQLVPRLSLAHRMLATVLAVSCLTVLVLASQLQPNPEGVGTHAGLLNLRPCDFLARSNLPCPSCGMTTSFAWFTRGNVAASLYVQPMGTVLALIAAMMVWAGGYIAVTGRPVHRLLRYIPAAWWLFPLMALAIAAWGWKMFIHLRGIDGWR